MVAHCDDELTVSDESHEVAWFTPEEVLQRTDEESIVRMLHKALEILG
jgi:hypothetical protein